MGLPSGEINATYRPDSSDLQRALDRTNAPLSATVKTSPKTCSLSTLSPPCVKGGKRQTTNNDLPTS
jgi:hypothetical protein